MGIRMQFFRVYYKLDRGGSTEGDEAEVKERRMKEYERAQWMERRGDSFGALYLTRVP